MRIHHVAMRSGDLERLKAFYSEVLGLAIVPVPGARTGSVWLEAGGAVLMLEQADDAEPGLTPGAMDLLAFAMNPDHDKTTWRARLERAGVRIEAETANTLYFRDPDGRRIGVSNYPLPAAMKP